VEDVAEAIARALNAEANPVTCELGGPRVYTYKELLTEVADRLGKSPVFVSVPFPLWHILARIAEKAPGAPLSRNQVELMETDTIASVGMPGFDVFGVAPQPIEQALEHILAGGSVKAPPDPL
jgi:uncharacterized protein YbjT (DUF2867 family)